MYPVYHGGLNYIKPDSVITQRNKLKQPSYLSVQMPTPFYQRDATGCVIKYLMFYNIQVTLQGDIYLVACFFEIEIALFHQRVKPAYT